MDSTIEWQAPLIRMSWETHQLLLEEIAKRQPEENYVLTLLRTNPDQNNDSVEGQNL
jgi:hypothetical protein